MSTFLHSLPLYIFIAFCLWLLISFVRHYGRDELIILGVFDCSGRRLDRHEASALQPADASSHVDYSFKSQGPGARLVLDEHGRIVSVSGPCHLRITRS